MSVLFSIVLAIALLIALAMLWSRKLAGEATRKVPRPGQLQPVPGGVMHYVDSGPPTPDTPDNPPPDNPPVVLIHGLGAQLQHFTYGLADKLAGEFRVISVDRPGCGYSTLDSGDGASFGQQAAMIDALLEKIGVKRALFVGHSLGGAISLRLALDFPGRCAGLALLAPLTQPQNDVPPVLKGLDVSNSRLRHILAATIAAPMAKLTTGKLLTAAFHPEPYPDDFEERAGLALTLRPSAFVAACSDLIAIKTQMAAQVARYETELKTPGAILYGDSDAIITAARHGTPMQAHGLRCEILPGRGHMLPIREMDRCVALIRQVARDAA